MHSFQADQMAVAEHLHGDTATLQQLRKSGQAQVNALPAL